MHCLILRNVNQFSHSKRIFFSVTHFFHSPICFWFTRNLKHEHLLLLLHLSSFYFASILMFFSFVLWDKIVVIKMWIFSQQIIWHDSSLAKHLQNISEWSGEQWEYQTKWKKFIVDNAYACWNPRMWFPYPFWFMFGYKASLQSSDLILHPKPGL